MKRNRMLTEWFPIREALRRYVIERRDIAESDVRDMAVYYNRDVMVVRLWNYRRIEVSGLDYVRSRHA